MTHRSRFYHIRDLRRIRRYISLSVVKTIAIALVTSRLDNWKSLLYNISSKDILKFQNCVARVVTRSPRFSHSVPLLKSPQNPCSISHHLRTFISIFHAFFSTQAQITPFMWFSLIVWVKLYAGTRAFSVAVPTLWNSLSEHVKSSNSIVSFRHHLKTHLFRLAYPS